MQYGKKFGYLEKDMAFWKDKPFLLKGEKKTGVVLVHGWSSGPRQMKTIAQMINKEGFWVSVPMLNGHGTVPEDLEDKKGEDWVDNCAKAIKELKEKYDLEKVVVGGISMGGNIAILASLKQPIDGLITIGTPVQLKNHLMIWGLSHLLKPFSRFKYMSKEYPRGLNAKFLQTTSYQYYPLCSVRQTLLVIRKSIYSLKKITAPVLILQTSRDYLIAKYSPWVIYNCVKSKSKTMQWIKSKNDDHVPYDKNAAQAYRGIIDFLKKIETSHQ